MINLLSKIFIKNYTEVENPKVRQSYGVLCGLVGIAFHNRNWPHILRCGRIWTIASLLGTPVLFGAIYFLFPAALGSSVKYAAVLLVLGGLFIPMCVTAKRHE